MVSCGRRGLNVRRIPAECNEQVLQRLCIRDIGQPFLRHFACLGVLPDLFQILAH